MGENRNTPPIAKYYAIILLSVADLVGGIICGLLSIYTGYMNVRIGYTGFGEDPIISRGTMPAIYGVIAVVCFVAYPILTGIRQKLRDEVEYDETGRSRSKGNFSQLSKKERDAIDAQKMIDAERILPSTMLKTITHSGPKDPQGELGAMTGLIEVKKKVNEMVARMVFENGGEEAKKKKKKKQTTETLSGMNMLFLGNPGTGKTTVARIMTTFLYEYGYIRKNQVIEVDGNFFMGLSKGESAKRASMLINAARGGVLFIDEAYSLVTETKSQEVIATIVKAMEDYRDDMVFIFAGYKKEMQEFINMNPGIASRVKYQILFPDYSSEELREIFVKMSNKQNLVPDAEICDSVVNELVYQKNQANFGNARSVRTMLDKIIDIHAVNLVEGRICEEDRHRLTKKDFLI